MSMNKTMAKDIANSYYKPGTIKNGLVVELLSSAYPQDKWSLSKSVGTAYIRGRLSDIETETPIRIARVKAVIGEYSKGKPSMLYSFGSFAA